METDNDREEERNLGCHTMFDVSSYARGDSELGLTVFRR